MQDLEKRIQINDNRVLIYSVVEGYAKPTYRIDEGFIENGDIIKTYCLSQWDDYGFYGWINNDEGIKKITFEFDIDHPLYFPLFHLLNYDEVLLIDDDDTREDNKKYILIYKKKNKIYIDFINNLFNNNYIIKKFHVFIKNIVFDGRSKIDRDKKDTKKRLIDFFNEVHSILTNDYHQISFEEWFLRNSTSDEHNQMKKVFKRKI